MNTTNTLLITGATGSGKSRLLVEAAKHCRMTMLDGLAEGGASWVEPDPIECQLIAIDHVQWIAPEVIVAALQWCDANFKPLWLVEQFRQDIEAKGIELPRDIVEIALDANASLPFVLAEEQGASVFLAAYTAISNSQS